MDDLGYGLTFGSSIGPLRWVAPAPAGLRDRGVPPGGSVDPPSARRARMLAGLEPEGGVWEFAGTVEIRGSGWIGVSGAGSPPGRSRVDGVRRIVARHGQVGILSAGPGGGREIIEAPPEGMPCQVAFLPQGFEIPADSVFRIGPDSDRRGIRLEGLRRTHALSLPSAPMCVGAIQVTPSGVLVVIGPDGPTIGGYPIAGVVVSSHLPRLAQSRIGRAVELQPVSRVDAIAMETVHRARLRRREAGLSVALNG